MSSFTKPLIIEYDYAGNHRRPYVVHEPFDYYTDLLPIPEICVPAGYRTDFASIPRILWRVLPPFGQYGKAAVIHDWLCDVEPKLCDNTTAADVFNEAMAVLGVGSFRRKVMTLAVKWFGPKFKGSETPEPQTSNRQPRTPNS